MSLSSIVLLIAALMLPGEPPRPFGEDWPRLDDDATGEWWLPQPAERGPQKKKGGLQPPRLLVPRDEVLAFALYTHDAGTLKLTAQLYPLKPGEPRTVQLEFSDGKGGWKLAGEQPVVYPGWSAHFRIGGWDASRDVNYRLRLGTLSEFTGGFGGIRQTSRRWLWR